MGVISIQFRGSFLPDTPRQADFGAENHGHVHAIRKAIAHLRDVCLPLAIAKDAKLRAAGEEPLHGFTEKDARWLDAHDARTPGAAIPSMEEQLRELGGVVDGAIPPGWAFVLIAASIGESGAFTYLSNGHRESMIALLREALGKFEAGESGTVGKPIEEVKAAVDHPWSRFVESLDFNEDAMGELSGDPFDLRSGDLVVNRSGQVRLVIECFHDREGALVVEWFNLDTLKVHRDRKWHAWAGAELWFLSRDAETREWCLRSPFADGVAEDEA